MNTVTAIVLGFSAAIGIALIPDDFPAPAIERLAYPVHPECLGKPGC